MWATIASRVRSRAEGALSATNSRPFCSSLRSLVRPYASLLVSSLLLVASSAYAEEPWSDPDPPAPPERHAVGDFGFAGGLEYRAQGTAINPLSLNTVSDRRAAWFEHRLRLDGTVDFDEKVRIVASFDVLDGVLWGDNGTTGVAPEANAGTNVNAKNPNVAVRCIQYKGGETGEPLSGAYYGYGLCEGEILKVRRAYGEVVTPIGLLRVGRQAQNLGNTVQGASGDGRANRWGIAGAGSYVDRIAFGTKPLEAFKEKEDRDLTLDRGLFAAVAYDHLVNDEIKLFGDNVQQVATTVFYKAPDWPGGENLELQAYWAHRWDDQYQSYINAFGGRAISRFGPALIGIEGAGNIGGTTEIAEAYRTITNDPPTDQTILQFGGRVVARLESDIVSGHLEFDYASGDGDPTPRTPLSAFVWAPDSNVGLLMFEHILQFQSARAAAAATEVLRRLNAPSFPVDTIDTRGSFTNAIAFFPQVDFTPHEDVLIRGGVLMAWSPEPVVDPVQSLLRRDGTVLEDDLQNFAGGKPGNFYGTEIDLRGRWRFVEHFALDLEGAILFPGDAFEDVNGDAARSVLVQGRTTFFF